MRVSNNAWIQQAVERPRGALARAAYAAGVLVIVVLAAWVIANQRVDPAVILGAIVALVAGAFLVKLGRFEYGILAIAITAGMVNFVSLPTGRDSRVVISLALYLPLLLLWVLQMLFDRSGAPRLKPSLLNKPLLIFVAINVVAYVWGNLMRDPLVNVWPSFVNTQIAALLVNIGLPLLALMVANKFSDVKWIKAVAWTIIAIGVFRAVSEEWSLPTERLGWNGARGLFPTWVATLALGLALFDHRLKTWQRAALLLLAGWWFHRTAIEGTGWLSGWIPMLVSFAVIVFFRSRKLFAALMLLVLVVTALNFDTFYTRIVVSNQDEGSESRLEIWAENLQHVANHPLLGMGPAGYAPYNMYYHAIDARSTHNNYFDVLAQNGIIGFISFVALMATIVMICVRNVRATRHQNDFEAAISVATLGGAIGALVAMMLGDWVLPFAYNQTITGFDNAAYTWTLLGCAAALDIIRRQRASTRTAPPRTI